MEKIQLNYHSFVDVITNSSTEMYTVPHRNTIQYVTDIINNVLMIAGSDKRAADLFDIKCVIEDYDDNDNLIYRDMVDSDYDECEGYQSRRIEITPKDPNQDGKFLDQINNLFDTQEFMC